MSSTVFEMLVFKEPRSLHSFFFTLCVLCIGPESTCQNCVWSVFDKRLCNSTEEQLPRCHPNVPFPHTAPPHPAHVLERRVH